jgi:phosphopentomutase
LKGAGFATIGVGKIDDIFAERGLTDSLHTTDNASSVEAILHLAGRDFSGLCLANLIDFDMLFGHRRDTRGFAEALSAFDRVLPDVSRAMKAEDLLVITADHGNDPGHSGTDHTREYVPLLAWSRGTSGETPVGERWMADLGATIAENFAVDSTAGSSFLAALTNAVKSGGGVH